MSTVTRTETHASIRPEIRFDIEYLRTMNGYLKVVVVLLGLINIILNNAAGAATSGYYNFVIGFAWWFTLSMLLLYLFHIPEKFYTLPWLPAEIGGICLMTLLYFIASLVSVLRPNVLATLAGLFGLVTTGVYFFSGFLKFKQWKAGDLAQGTLLSRSTTTSTQPNIQTAPSAFPA